MQGKHLTLIFAGCAHAFSHFVILLFATVVLALEGEWGLGYADLQWLSVLGFVLFGVAALPAGWIADRWSQAGMIGIFFFGVGLALLMVGLATSPLGLMVGLTALGLFASIYHPVGIPWLVRNAANPGRALGINGVFGSTGTALAPVVAGGLAQYFGWRMAFIAPGLVCLTLGLIYLWSLKRGYLQQAPASAGSQPAYSGAQRLRVFLVLGATVICTGLIYQSTAVALPKIIDERLGEIIGGVFAIGGIVTLAYIGSSVTQVVGGELADRFPLKPIYVFAQLSQIPAIYLAYRMQSPALVGALILMVSLNTFGQPAENSLLARYVPSDWQGRAFGVKFVLALGVGALGVSLVPFVHGLFGNLDPLFLVLMGFAGLGSLAALSLPPTPKGEATGETTAVVAEVPVKPAE
jgi:MFS family permease